MFEKEWLPQAISIGISQEQFWTMNPRKIKIEMDGYAIAKKRKLEEENNFAYLQGMYFLEALSVLGSSFGKGKRHQYPSKPYELNLDEDKKLSKKEKDEKAQLLLASIDAMGRNFNLSKQGKEN